MQEDRRLAVLRAIVEDYVSTREPVGSKALVERHRLGVSPATVRNDMAALEEEGLIAQPHTSAGRIPTDKGYRFFVDRLTQIKPMSAAERRAISTFLEGAHDLDDVIQRSVRVLAQLTAAGRASCSTRPLARSTRAPRRAGRAHPDADAGRADPLHRAGSSSACIELPARARPTSRWPTLRSRILRAAVGERITEAAAALGAPGRAGRPRRADPGRTRSRRRWSRRCPTSVTTSAWWWAAPPTWPASATGFDQSIKPMLEALEEHVVLLKLLGEATSSGSVTVRIGHEGPVSRSWPPPRWSRPATARVEARGVAWHRGSHPDGLPRLDGGCACGRPLRLHDPRPSLRSAYLRHPAPPTYTQPTTASRGRT